MIMQFRGGYNYTEFGIPTYHGIVNMLFLFVFPSLYYHFLLSKRKNYSADYTIDEYMGNAGLQTRYTDVRPRGNILFYFFIYKKIH